MTACWSRYFALEHYSHLTGVVRTVGRRMDYSHVRSPQLIAVGPRTRPV